MAENSRKYMPILIQASCDSQKIDFNSMCVTALGLLATCFQLQVA